MRSRAVKLTLSALVLAALGAVAFFVYQTEQQIANRRSATRLFEERVRAVDRALAEVRAGQNAYVAAGQSAGVWIPKVSSAAVEAAQTVDVLRTAAMTADARSSLMEAAATIVEIGNVDRRVVDYLKSGQQVMAADVVYSEAGPTVATAANHVDSARALELQGQDVAEREDRQLQAYALAASGLATVGLLLLFAAAPTVQIEQAPSVAHDLSLKPIDDDIPPMPAAVRIEDDVPRHSAPTMKAAAEICTEIGRVNDRGDLVRLLGRAAELMDASGLVIWMGNTSGGELRPALAHGYSSQILGRMPAVAKNENNAAASAYRTGVMQIVLARPGVSSGALVAPLLTPDGCIGALSAEIRSRGETSDTTQALVVLFAAQLAAVLAPAAALPIEAAETNKIASA
jgi:hypothetical protein